MVFEQKVTVHGDLHIQATGVVRFDSTVHVIGGRLIIEGADEVIFTGGVELTQSASLPGGVSGLLLDEVYRARFVDDVWAPTGGAGAGGNLMLSGGGRVEGSVVPGGSSEVLRLAISGSSMLVLNAIDAERPIDLGGISLSATDVGRLSVIDTVIAPAGRSIDLSLRQSAGGVGGELRLLRDVVGGSGHVTIESSGLLSLLDGADVRADGGTLQLLAGGDLRMTAASVVGSAATGDLRLSAGGSMQISSVTSQAEVALTTLSGSIAVVPSSAGMVKATGLRVDAGGAVGTAVLPITADVDVLSLNTRSASNDASVFIAAAGSLELDAVTVTTQRVNGQGGLTPTIDSALPGVTVAGRLSLSTLREVAADILFDQAVAVAGHLQVAAWGDVRFDESVRVTAGGLLQIVGTDELRFDKGVDLMSASGLRFESVERIAFTGAVVSASAAGTAAGGNLLIVGGGLVEGTGRAAGSAALEVLRLTLSGPAAVAVRAFDANAPIDLGSITLIGQDVGVMTVTDRVVATGDRGLHLVSAGAGGELHLLRNVQAQRGAISLEADSDIVLTDRISVTTTSGGTINIASATGDVVMTPRNVVTAQGGDLRLRSAGPILAGTLSAHGIWLDTDGAVPVLAGGALSVAAQELRLDVGGPIGTALQPYVIGIDRLSLSTRTAGAGIFLSAVGDTTLGGTTIEVYRPDGLGGVQTLGGAGTAGVRSAGDLVLDAGGTITVAAAGQASAAGNMRLSARGPSSDIVIAGAVHSDAGHLTLLADRDVLQQVDLDLSASSGTIEMLAGRDLRMSEGVLLEAGGDARLAAGGSLILSRLEAAAANVALLARGGSIVDGRAAGDSALAHVRAAGLLLEGAAVGTTARPLLLAVDRLAAVGGADGVWLQAAGSADIGMVAIDVRRVGLDGQAVPVPTGAGAWSTQGAGVQSSGGDVRISAAQDLRLLSNQSVLNSAGGAIVLTAQGHWTQAAGARVDSGGGNVTVQSGGALTMDATAQIDAGAGLLQLQSTGAMTLGELAGSTVSGTSTGGAIVAQSDIATGAGGLVLSAEVDLSLLAGMSATAAGAATLTSAQGAVSVGAGATLNSGMALSVTATQGAVTVAAGANLSSGAALRVTSTQGTVTVGTGAALSSGAALSVTAGMDMDLAAQAVLSSAGGAIVLTAQGHWTQAAGAQVDSGGGNVTVQSGGALTMDATAQLDAGTGLLQLQSTRAMTLGELAGSTVSGTSTGGAIVAQSDIATGAGGLVLSAEVDLSLLAGMSATAAGAATLTSAQGAVSVGAGANLSSGAALSVTSTQGAVTLAAGANLTSGAALSVTSTQGTVTVGTGATLGSGTALSVTAGLDMDLAAQAVLNSAGGAIVLTAQGNWTQGAGAQVRSGGGEVAVQSGTLTMDATASIQSQGGAIRLRAEDGLEIGMLDAVPTGQPTAAGGVITVRSDSPASRIVSAQAATGLNARASALRMQGYGLRLGDEGRALRVEARSLDLSAPGGVLARQTQADGETHHVAMVGDALYLQVASLGVDPVASGRVPLPELIVAPPPQVNLQPAAATQDRARAAGVALSGAASWASSSLAAGSNLSGLARVADLGSAEVTWLQMDADESQSGDELSRAFVLGSVSSQPAQAGVRLTEIGSVDYWLDDLYL